MTHRSCRVSSQSAAHAASRISPRRGSNQWSGSQAALVHIGDSRAYLLRGGELTQLTQDHSYVQSLVDQGKLAPGEAFSHPERALLVRALGSGAGQVEADLALRTGLVGDRYLLCSDGLSAVVDRGAIHAALSAPDPPKRVAVQLIISRTQTVHLTTSPASSPTPSRRRGSDAAFAKQSSPG